MSAANKPSEPIEFNQVELTGRLIGRDALRYTPAGIALLNGRLEHRSRQIEAGSQRDVEFEVELLFAGEAAVRANRLELGQNLVVGGFLAPRRKQSKSLTLHVARYEQSTESIIESN